jgi:hypothetical protein
MVATVMVLSEWRQPQLPSRDAFTHLTIARARENQLNL